MIVTIHSCNVRLTIQLPDPQIQSQDSFEGSNCWLQEPTMLLTNNEIQMVMWLTSEC